MWQLSRSTPFAHRAVGGRQRSQFGGHSPEILLTHLVDAGIAALLCLAPLFMGGRHPLGRLVYVALVCVVVVAWLVRQAFWGRGTWRWSGVEVLIVAAIGVVSFQLARLPHSWLTSISPTLPDLLPLWFGDESLRPLGQWSQLSLHPEATRSGLTMLLTYAGFFLILIQRIETLDDIERLFRWISLAAIAMASLGVVQLLSGNGSFLWIYEHPSRDTHGVVRGTFACQNHLAHLLAISVTAIIWWTQQVIHGAMNTGSGQRSQHFSRGRRAAVPTSDAQLSLLLIGTGVVALACILTLSRGGILIIFLTTSICVAGYVALSLLGRNSIVAIAATALLLVAGSAIYGFEGIVEEIGSLSTLSVTAIDVGGIRQELWSADVETFRDFFIVGTGVGSHSEVYPLRFERNLGVELTYAESGYVQLLLETGIVGVGLLVVAVGFVTYWSVSVFRSTKDKRVRSLLVVIVAVLVASLVNSIWDFVWYIPACLTVTLTFTACLCRLHQITRGSLPDSPDQQQEVDSRPRRSRQLRWSLGACIATAVGFMMIGGQIPRARAASHWDAYRIQVKAAKTQRQSGLDELNESVASMLPILKAVAKRDPTNARAHLKLAAVYLHRFEVVQQNASNPFTGDQIRRAIKSAPFASVEDQNEWLELAIGENCENLRLAYRHALQAARLSPLQGEAYIHLHRLSFLHTAQSDASGGLLEQALTVRPHHGQILLAAGLAAAEEGDETRMLEYLRRAFHQGTEFQRSIVELLAPSVPAKFFLEEFAPQLDGLSQLVDFYRASGQRTDLRDLMPSYVTAVEQASEKKQAVVLAAAWLRGHSAYKLLADDQHALWCARKAVEVAPNHLGANVAYATQLIDNRRYDEAMQHLRTCMYDTPNAAELQRLMMEAKTQKGRIDSRGLQATSPNSAKSLR